MHYASRAVLLLAPLLLSACGGDSNSTPDPKSQGVKTLSSNPTPGTNASGPSTDAPPPAATMEEARNRQKVKILAEALAKAKDPMDQADELGKIKEAGPAAKELSPAVLKLAKSEDPMVRAAALETIAAIDATIARPHLEAGLKDEDPEVRQKAAEGWLAAKITDVSPLILQLGDESDSRVQMASLVTIEKLAPDYAVDQVAGLLGNINPAAAKPALRFLTAKKSIASAPKIAELLNWSNVELRVEAASSLATIGAKSKPILEALARGLIDSEATVRKACHQSLKTLTGQNLDYDPNDEGEDLKAAAKLWRDWVTNNG